MMKMHPSRLIGMNRNRISLWENLSCIWSGRCRSS